MEKSRWQTLVDQHGARREFSKPVDPRPTLKPDEFIRRLNIGTDWSGKWTCVWSGSGMAILRKSSGKYWSGRGLQSYSPVRWVLVSLEDSGYGGVTLMDRSTVGELRKGRMDKAEIEFWKKIASDGVKKYGARQRGEARGTPGSVR